MSATPSSSCASTGSVRSGPPGVVLSTLPAMHAAHRLYERHGFVRAPERDWSPAARVDLVAYHLDLAP